MDSSNQELQMNVRHEVKAALNDVLEQIQNASNSNCNNQTNYNENEGVSPIETTPLANNRYSIPSKNDTSSKVKRNIFSNTHMSDKDTNEYATLEFSEEDLFLDGYDSDGKPAPYLTPDVQEKILLKEYCNIAVGKQIDVTGTESVLDATIETSEKFVMIEETEMKKLKVDALRRELKSRGLSSNGLKPEIFERLKQAMIKNTHKKDGYVRNSK